MVVTEMATPPAELALVRLFIAEGAELPAIGDHLGLQVATGATGVPLGFVMGWGASAVHAGTTHS